MTLRVLLVHNRYREEGGEDLAFEADVRLLRAHGHSVAELTDDSQRIQGFRQVGLGVRAIWSSEFEDNWPSKSGKPVQTLYTFITRSPCFLPRSILSRNPTVFPLFRHFTIFA